MKKPGENEKENSAEAIAEKKAWHDNRRFQVSSNRGAATHRVRYLESGGGEADPNCRVCKPAVKPR